MAENQLGALHREKSCKADQPYDLEEMQKGGLTMRLIDADALLMQMMHKFHYELPDGCNNPLYGDVIDVIEDAPTIDAEPVRHGQWVETADGGYADAAMRCSACDFQFENWSGLFAYCPVCGAKMDALTFEEASRKLGQQAAETLKKLKEAGYA